VASEPPSAKFPPWLKRQVMPLSKVFMLYPLISQKLMRNWRDRFPQRYNLGSGYHHMHKSDQNRRASVIARAHKDRAWDLGRRASLKNSRESPPYAIHKWRPHVAPTRLGRWMETAQSPSTLGDLKATRKRQSRYKLLIGNWNILSLRGRKTNWSRKPNDIPWMLWHLFDKTSWL